MTKAIAECLMRFCWCAYEAKAAWVPGRRSGSAPALAQAQRAWAGKLEPSTKHRASPAKMLLKCTTRCSQFEQVGAAISSSTTPGTAYGTGKLAS